MPSEGNLAAGGVNWLKVGINNGGKGSHFWNKDVVFVSGSWSTAPAPSA